MSIIFVDNLEQSLKNLTSALQESESRNNSGEPTQFPVRIDPCEFELSPEVFSFIETNRVYREKTRHICVGMY